jgi:hypothetical protein
MDAQFAKDARVVENYNKKTLARSLVAMGMIDTPTIIKSDTQEWRHPKLSHPFATAPVHQVQVGSGDLPRCMEVCTRLTSAKPFSLNIVGKPGCMPSKQTVDPQRLTEEYSLEPFKNQGGLPLVALQFQGFEIVATDPDQVIWVHGELWPPNSRAVLCNLNNFVLDDGNIKLHCTLPRSGATVVLDGPNDPGFDQF